jgi:hypothetical protein
MGSEPFSGHAQLDSEALRKRALTPFLPAPNLFAAHIAQLVEHFLGKEEVTGSTPVVGSRLRAVGP